MIFAPPKIEKSALKPCRENKKNTARGVPPPAVMKWAQIGATWAAKFGGIEMKITRKEKPPPGGGCRAYARLEEHAQL